MSPLPLHVGIGEFAVAEGDGQLAIYGLGSCAALILFDLSKKRGGMAHVLLPGGPASSDPTPELPAKFASHAVALLVEGLSGSSRLEAAIVGGASLFGADSPVDTSIGKRNVDSLKEYLDARGIPLRWEETGGETGRSVRFELPQCIVRVRTLRQEWRVLGE